MGGTRRTQGENKKYRLSQIIPRLVNTKGRESTGNLAQCQCDIKTGLNL
jgi:hypothetical protein